MVRLRGGLGLVVTVAIVSCGGERPPPKSGAPGEQRVVADGSSFNRPPKGARSFEPEAEAAPGARDDAAGQSIQQAPRASPAPEPVAPAAGAAAEPSRGPATTDPRGHYARAQVAFANARREVQVATDQRDCAGACRALDSMERAARQVCGLAQSPEERRTCASAEEQVGAARVRVKSACGECSRK